MNLIKNKSKRAFQVMKALTTEAVKSQHRPRQTGKIPHRQMGRSRGRNTSTEEW